MLNKSINRVVIITSFIFGLFFTTPTIFAQDNGRAFTVSPPVFELKANPGDNLSEVVSIFNNGNEDLAIATTIENLKPMGEKGQVQVIGNSTEGLPSLRDWIKIENPNFNLLKNDSKNVKFSIAIPSNAEPGGHFVTVLFGTTGSKTDGTGALLSQKIGTLVFLTVAGEAKEQALITSFNSSKKLYLENQTINYNLKILNEGNVYLRPRGFLVITDIFGRKVEQIEIDGKNILPGATREIPLEFKSKHLFGPYTSTLTLVYGNTNQNLSSSCGFWIIPWISTTITVLVLLLIFILRRRLLKAFRILVGKEN